MKKAAISFVQRLADKEPLLGSLVSTGSTEVSEALSLCGFEWLFLDVEHSVLDMASAQRIVQTVAARTYCVIRLPHNSPEHFKKALDTGCDGIVVPLVNSAVEAKAAVDCAKYTPLGSRGVGLARAQGYGLNFSEYLRSANQEIALILQIEHKKAVEQIEEIVNVPGIDAIFIGPYDLSASMGLLGQPGASDVVGAIRHVRQVCVNREIPFGSFCMTPNHALDEIANGGTLIVLGSDLSFMTNSAKAALGTVCDR
ncbi:MAG: HpcH/HpaI aldolase family protein [Terriglobales bacterium]